MTVPPDDDAAWAPPSAAPAAPAGAGTSVPALLGGYRDVVQLARGGDSIVYRARDEAVGRDVAIKVVLLEDPESVARFRRELEITVRLGRQHPHIMTVLAVDTTVDGQPCLVMDYFELGSLQDRLRDRGALPVNEVVAAGSVIADALAFAHAQGLLHRDVKPQNILVLPTSYVLADFGLARAIDAGHSSSLERFSYRHASPQILDGEPPTVADDVYSLGSTLYTLLDGRPPFAAEDADEDSALSYLRRARTEAPRPLVRDGVPPALAEIVARCLSKRREDRFPDARQLRDALHAVPTESRSWAPEPAAAPPVPASAPPVAPVVRAAESGWAPAAAPAAPAPVVSEPVVSEPVIPERVVSEPATPPAGTVPPPQPPPSEFLPPAPVAVSALAHLDPAAGRRDSESTGLRPDATAQSAPAPSAPAHAAPTRSRWVPLAIGVLVALVVGVVIGVVRSGGKDAPVASGPRTSASPSPSLQLSVPQLSATPSGPSGSAVFDPKIAPRITKLDRTGTRVDLAWTDPTKGVAAFLVALDDRITVATPPPGSTSITLNGFPSGSHCVRIVTVLTDADGDPVYGRSARSCSKG